MISILSDDKRKQRKSRQLKQRVNYNLNIDNYFSFEAEEWFEFLICLLCGSQTSNESNFSALWKKRNRDKYFHVISYCFKFLWWRLFECLSVGVQSLKRTVDQRLKCKKQICCGKLFSETFKRVSRLKVL